ncbi:MAG TPA: DUF4432 family protein [Bryobacteraceae bacterium]|nr:DUF4432 family protein [Bryobacteraceae bacterium]
MAAASEVTYLNRRAVRLENEQLRVTATVEGGHIAEIRHKASGVNPLWTPIWPSIEPSKWNRSNPIYGDYVESHLLSGILGHNLCLDMFGPPSDSEAKQGLSTHGEANVVPYECTLDGGSLVMKAQLPMAQLRFTRKLRLDPDGKSLHIEETVENLTALDRPIAWTQHATLGPPFLERGKTQFRASATKSRTYEQEFGDLPVGQTFDWPNAPRRDGSIYDLRVYNDRPSSSGFTTHLMDPHREKAFFVAWHPDTKVAFGYEWKRTDFPWLGIWEENNFREHPPWNRKSLTRGMEFGASPFPETRREMIERRELFGVPAYRWLPAKGSATAVYRAFAFTSPSVPEQV